ncbi:hypothetical protein P167DRAFT_339915 [Morchella conica CCBAS932]|uniref:Uncharacterized protein n=1 Tax=Morchella conica CCBAS932 TaxID=1392247 RepID=A0A3N4KDP1_9PEZI|nr:hypothetical protein P167DRAFT_339915 [Morchella conica CCBAS932]
MLLLYIILGSQGRGLYVIVISQKYTKDLQLHIRVLVAGREYMYSTEYKRGLPAVLRPPASLPYPAGEFFSLRVLNLEG